MVHRTYEELSEMDDDERAFYFEQERKAVFGDSYKLGRDGKPVEQGIGSKSQPTIQSMAALLAAEGVDSYQRAVKEATARGVWPPQAMSDEAAFAKARAEAVRYDPTFRHREPT
jgi:hypothetical protein